MTIFNICIQDTLNTPEISNKLYKQGDAEYTIYNYNKDNTRLNDFSNSAYQCETFHDELTNEMNNDTKFCEWVYKGEPIKKINNTQDQTFLGELPLPIQRDTCEPISWKLNAICKNFDISIEELLDMYKRDVTYHAFGNYRSVVTYNDKIVSFAPIKSVSSDVLKNVNGSNLINVTGELYANEVIEGTMINLFYNKVIGTWEIATKSAIGGNYWFFRTQYDDSSKQMTFRQMFMEALGEDPNSELDKSKVVCQLNIDYTYSFVMQHPANHIVLNIQKPSLYLVAGFKIEDNTITTYTPEDIMTNVLKSTTHGIEHILIPRVVDISGKSITEICNMSENYNAGIMLHSKINGQRVKIMNNTYERLRDIRGNNPNIHYHYLSLFAAGKVDEFLSVFPMYKKLFYKFYNQSYEFIKEIHDAYVSYYVKKMGKSVRINKSIFTHIYNLHNKYYIPTIDSEHPTIVTRDVVSKYYNAMTPKEKLYHVTYKTREYTNKTFNDESSLISVSY
jgi:hypothetical protein